MSSPAPGGDAGPDGDTGRPGGRSWRWTAAFSAILVGMGGLDLVRGEALAGAGLVACGLGAALMALGERRERVPGRGRPWQVVGTAVALAGLGLLGIHVFG